jgi:hypothetical protein
MTKRATFTEAELMRAWNVARRVGAVVEVSRGAIRLLPEGADSGHADPSEDDEVAVCDRLFGVSCSST